MQDVSSREFVEYVQSGEGFCDFFSRHSVVLMPWPVWIFMVHFKLEFEIFDVNFLEGIVNTEASTDGAFRFNFRSDFLWTFV